MNFLADLLSSLIIVGACYIVAYGILSLIFRYKTKEAKIYKPKACNCKLNRELCHSQVTYTSNRNGVHFHRDMVNHFKCPKKIKELEEINDAMSETANK